MILLVHVCIDDYRLVLVQGTGYIQNMHRLNFSHFVELVLLFTVIKHQR